MYNYEVNTLTVKYSCLKDMTPENHFTPQLLDKVRGFPKPGETKLYWDEITGTLYLVDEAFHLLGSWPLSRD